ncbi:glycoside hydrolase family 18 protein [Coniochaeta sp. 2T2.1]|nr:glycoside hydrolase family 18 protein [Coniochaeta sp. 2T2.1]
MRTNWSLLLTLLSAGFLTAHVAAVRPLRCVMYLTGQHPITPEIDQIRHVTHVILAFMGSSIFNEPARSEWPLIGDYTNVNQIRALFSPETKIMVAIGGWGDTYGFSAAALSEQSRKNFANNVARMVFATGVDGVDVDWEYPGGNGEDYKTVPNKAKEWEIGAYPLLLAELRQALGSKKIISAAVPGLARDMIAFNSQTVPRIMRHVDFLNVMTYDLMNRRDTVTRHHTGIVNSLEAVDAYVSAGATPQMLNLGFAFYVKWFKTSHDGCSKKLSPLGCPTLLLEDPKTGADLGRAGGFSWHDAVPAELGESFGRALDDGTYDDKGGGYYYWDEQEDLFWTFETADAISRKVPAIMDNRRLGGVFAWGLGEDAPVFEHFKALIDAVALHNGEAREEL